MVHRGNIALNLCFEYVVVIARVKIVRSGCRRVDPLRAKKLHVLAACEVERHRKRTLGGAGPSRQVLYDTQTYRRVIGYPALQSDVRLFKNDFCLSDANIAPNDDEH